MIKHSVILKNVNENCVYAIDCESEDNVFFKFEGVSKLFLEELQAGKSKEEIIACVMDKFTGVDKHQVETDYQDFLQSIESFSIIKP